MKSVNITNTAELKAGIAGLSREKLEEALIDIAMDLSFDDGEHNPEQSMAADSGADFVDSVTQTFHRMGISI